MNWLDDFKIALIEEDERRLASLVGQIPAFETTEEIESAMRLIAQARTLMEAKKDQVAKEMREIETAKKFLTSSEEPPESGKLDITS
ncbi:hypothetical protein [Hydrogenimonas sp.]